MAGFRAEGFEGGDDLVQVRLDLAEVAGDPAVPVGVCIGDQAQAGGGLPAVDVQELGRGLEVGAGQAGVGVRAVLLRGRPQ
jgi:hypothetical protein